MPMKNSNDEYYENKAFISLHKDQNMSTGFLNGKRTGQNQKEQFKHAVLLSLKMRKRP